MLTAGIGLLDPDRNAGMRTSDVGSTKAYRGSVLARFGLDGGSLEERQRGPGSSLVGDNERLGPVTLEEQKRGVTRYGW